MDEARLCGSSLPTGPIALPALGRSRPGPKNPTWLWWDSNPRPSDPQSDALTTALRGPVCFIFLFFKILGGSIYIPCCLCTYLILSFILQINFWLFVMKLQWSVWGKVNAEIAFPWIRCYFIDFSLHKIVMCTICSVTYNYHFLLPLPYWTRDLMVHFLICGFIYWSFQTLCNEEIANSVCW